MRVEVINSADDFRQIKTQWNNILLTNEKRTVFLTWEWQYSWWEAYSNNKELLILALYDDFELVAIAPFFIERANYLWPVKANIVRFLGTGIVASDYLGIICRQNSYREAWESLINFLRINRNDCHLILLEDLPNTSPEIDLLRSVLKEKKLSFSQIIKRTCSYIPLKGSWDEYLKSLTRKRRKKINQTIRKVENDLSAEFKIVKSENELNLCFGKLIQYQLEKFSEVDGISSFSFPKFVKFHEKLARIFLKDNILFMTYLRGEGESILSVNYAFKYANKVFDYNAGYNKQFHSYSLGAVLMSLSIKNAIENNIIEWDLTRGDSAYKRHFTNEYKENVSLLIGIKQFIYTYYLLRKNLNKVLLRIANKLLPRRLINILRDFSKRIAFES